MLRMRLSKKYICASDVGFRRTFQPVIYRGMSVFGICRFFKNSQSPEALQSLSSRSYRSRIWLTLAVEYRNHCCDSIVCSVVWYSRLEELKQTVLFSAEEYFIYITYKSSPCKRFSLLLNGRRIQVNQWELIKFIKRKSQTSTRLSHSTREKMKKWVVMCNALVTHILKV